jgi:O-antigen/teichoic acid export membrane protein
MAVFGLPFIERWIGHEYDIAGKIMMIQLFPITMALMQGPSIQLLYGISEHRFVAIGNIIEGITTLILSLVLVHKYGIIGVAWASAVPMFIMKVFVQPVYTCRAIRLSLVRYFKEAVVPVIVKSVVIFTIIYAALRNWIVPEYPVLLVEGIGAAVIFSTIVFYWGFSRSERVYMVSIISRTRSGHVFLSPKSLDE